METETGMVDTNMDQNESAVKNATQIGEPMDVDPKPPQKDKDSWVLLCIAIECSYQGLNNPYFVDRVALAEAKKAEGNKEYAKKNYDEAVVLYTEAIGNR